MTDLQIYMHKLAPGLDDYLNLKLHKTAVLLRRFTNKPLNRALCVLIHKSLPMFINLFTLQGEQNCIALWWIRNVKKLNHSLRIDSKLCSDRIKEPCVWKSLDVNCVNDCSCFVSVVALSVAFRDKVLPPFWQLVIQKGLRLMDSFI